MGRYMQFEWNSLAYTVSDRARLFEWGKSAELFTVENNNTDI